MAKLTNDFSWSISRGRLFRECARKYYYHYYGSWEGWSPEGPESARLCYRLKQIKNFPMWAGDIVHRVIETAIKGYRRGRSMSLESMQQMARDALNSEWKESEDSLWMRGPKKYTNLFEHYYKRDITSEDRADLRQRIFDSLKNFFEMGYPQRLSAVAPDDWKTIEDFQSFTAGDLKVWAVIDCAHMSGEQLYIYDWKTGKADNDEQAGDQLVCYALYAASQWEIPLDSIHVAYVYLRDAVVREFDVPAEQIIEFKERMFQSAQQMQERLADAKRNVAREQDFPRVEDPAPCKQCEFFEACYGDRSLQPPTQQ